MMDYWNTICYDLLKERDRQATEKEYQSKVFTHFFYLLGWYSESVKEQYQLRVGSTINYVYPDIVFFLDNEPVFVIEMKKPNNIQTKEEIIQLHSYMKLLSVQFGIYIGEHIELFYNDPSIGKDLVSILKIELTPDSDSGKKFIELFKREYFSTDNLRNFCVSQLEKVNKERQLNEYVSELTTEKGINLMTELLTAKLYNDGYTSDAVNKILKNIEIKIFPKNNVPSTNIKQKTIVNPPLPNNYKSKSHDHTRYSLNGRGYYGKGRLALEITKQYVKDNPNLTYLEIKRHIPLAISPYNRIRLWKQTTSDKSKETRWFEDKDDLMTSADGITFAFTTQISRHNIGTIIDFGKLQGYKIESIQ